MQSNHFARVCCKVCPTLLLEVILGRKNCSGQNERKACGRLFLLMEYDD